MFKEICKLICDREHVLFEQTLIRTRKYEVVYTRQLIQYFCREFQLGDEEYIAQLFHQDRCTIFNSVKAIQNYYDTDKTKRAQIDSYRRELTNIKKGLHGQGGMKLAHFVTVMQGRGVRMPVINSL